MDLSLLALHSLSWLSLICLILAAAGCLYGLAAAYCAGRYAARPAPVLVPGSARPSVTVLKPLCGLEPNLYENLETVLCQDYAGPVQVVFGVQKASDPAIDVVISGHTHNAYICQMTPRGGQRRLLTSAGKYGGMVTDIRLSFSPAGELNDEVCRSARG